MFQFAKGFNVTMGTTSRFAALVIIFFLCNIPVDFPFLSSFLKTSETNAAQLEPQDLNTEVDYIAISQAFTKVAKAVIPAIVSINSIMMVYASELWKDRLSDQELREFFGDKYLNIPLPREFRQKGSGSGIIVTEDGYIITNMHVVEKAEEIVVTLADNRSFNAALAGADPLTELALIKIDVTDLPFAELGDSDSLAIGEWVLAIGNPLELKSTVTAGIVSAIGRDINIISDNYGVENFIQTDATINPGNSGGALVNLKGQVIGINTAIATQSGYNQGYGFAIPINLAKEVIKDLIRYGYVVRSYLGISMQDVNEKIARALGLKHPSGVFIDQVAVNSPAQKYGLREKDVLIKIDNQAVNKGNIVQSIIAQREPGDVIVLTVIREHRILKISVILGERRGDRVKPLEKSSNRKFHNLGLEVENISLHLAKEFSLEKEKGVLVTSVKQFSPAFDSGIQMNDIILEIDNQLINSVQSFETVINELEGGKVYIFKMQRNENTFHVFVEVEK